ncbi:MAG: tRNA (guanosine(46)-N7)-methyltransferase TrmB [Firmicutes bacterium]|nr:tRNA (guanosine(46)-N7)-methyltransferase TrmB [Bacillota bacterium]
MRQRKVKNEEEKIAQYDHWIVEDPAALKGRWNEAFEEARPEIYMEIGCGKGKFITGMAKKFPERNYIAVEGAGTVVLRALEKAGGEELENVRFITDYINEMGDFFEQGEVRGIFLNFSDPWPKKAHAKRRLTHRRYLTEYKKVLAPGSILEFKSDNDGLFQFSVQEFYDFGLEILEMTDDLHNVMGGAAERSVVLDADEKEVELPGPGEGAAASAQVTTEYEDRFTSMGKNIHYCRVRF